MKDSLLDIYNELKESNSTSSFPRLLADQMYKMLITKFKGVNSPWRLYTVQSDLADFKTHNRVMLSEAPDLIEIPESGPYTDSTLVDSGYPIRLITMGRTFTVSRQAVINDDLQGLRGQPERFGRAAGRSIAKRIALVLEASGVAYDGNEFFSLAHGNLGNALLTNDAAGIAALSAAMTAMEKSTDPDTGEKYGIQAKYLLVPPDLEDVAMRLVNGTAFVPVSTSGGTTEIGKVRRLTPIVEPFLTSTTGWYLLADPSDLPAIEVGFLKGKQQPDLLLRDSNAIFVSGGGKDEFGYEFDDISYKVRFDFGVARAMYQAAYKGHV